MTLIAGRFRPLEELGSGSMGVVFRAWDELLEREVALKELRVAGDVDLTEAVDRFVGEARAAGRLQHPSIVTVYDVVVDADRVLIAMEMLEGRTLGEELSAGTMLPAAATRHLGSHVADALAEAHARDVVHRDLKPDNIFWLPSGRVVVVDFGLARIGAGRGTRLGTIMGTPGYMAPEQVRGEDVGPAADVFAWGAILYEALTGRPTFGTPDLDVAALLYRIVNEHPPPLDVPEDPRLAELVMAALDKDPTRRPPDGAALVEGLRSAQPPAAWDAIAQNPPAAQPSVPRSIPVAAVVAAVVVIAAVIVGAAFLLLGGDSSSPAAVASVSTTTTRRPAEVAPTTAVSTSETTVARAPVVPLPLVGAVATSSAPDGIDSQSNPVGYGASNVIDGDPTSTWRTQGDGVGERLVLQLDAPAHIRRVGLIAGYAKVDPFDGTDRFFQNRRILTVRWDLGGGNFALQHLDPGNRQMQYVDVDAETDTVTVEILETTEAGGRDFTAISEMDVQGSV